MPSASKSFRRKIQFSYQRLENRNLLAVNGLSEFTFTGSFDRTRFDLDNGDDEVALDGFEAGSELRFLGGDGNDRLEGTAVTARFFHIQGNGGDDSVQFNQSASRRSSYFFLGEGDDVLAIDSFVAGRNLKVFGNTGNDTFASSTLTVERKYRLNLQT